MNRTFLSLSLSYSLSKPNTFSKSFLKQSFSMKKSKLFNFAHSFAKFYEFNGPVSFSKTHFSNFLNTPVTFNSISYHGQTINKYTLISQTTDFSSCLFQQCTCPDYDGGALAVKADGITLSITKSSFYQCKAPNGHGGAISFQSDSLYLKNTCFLECESEYSGPGVDATSFTDKNLYFEGSSIDQCPNNLLCSIESKGPIFFFQGSQRCVESNFTGNKIANIACGFYTDDSITFTLTYSNFANNVGINTVYIEDVKNRDDFNNINFINNTCPIKTNGIIFTTRETTLEKGVFVENTEMLVESVSQVSFVFYDTVFDHPYSEANATDMVTVHYNKCKTTSNPETLKFSVFDQRYCWMIDPPPLPAGNDTYWFFILFFIFAGFVSYSTFISFKKITGSLTTPLIANSASAPSYDKV